MGCGSSTATSTVASRPAPAPVPKSTSTKSLKERNGHAQGIKDNYSGSPEANGHVLHQSKSQTSNESKHSIKETAGDNVNETSNTNVNDLTGANENQEEAQLSKRDDSPADQEPIVEPISSGSQLEGGGSVATEKKDVHEEPEATEEGDIAEALGSSGQGNHNAGESSEADSMQHRVNADVANSGLEGSVSSTKEINKVTLSGKPEETAKQTDTNDTNTPVKESLAENNSSDLDIADREVPASRETSNTNLSGDTATHSNTSVEPMSHRAGSHEQEQTDRADSIRNSDGEIHLSQQDLGFSPEINEPSTVGPVQALERAEMSKKEVVSLNGEEEQGQKENGVTGGNEVDVSDRQDSVLKDETAVEGRRICTVTANVRIASLEESLGRGTVTLSASVYRLASEERDVTTPTPGEKIGFVKGEVTSAASDDESSCEMLAALSGDLFAVTEEALANGVVATALVDVVSFYSGEKVATITADLTPSDDPEHQSGVLTGEVLAGSDNGSYDEKIGSLSGNVVALTFDDQPVVVANAGH